MDPFWHGIGVFVLDSPLLWNVVQFICLDNNILLVSYLELSGCISGTSNSCRSVPRKFLGIFSQDPSDSKSNQLHVDIFQFCFI